MPIEEAPFECRLKWVDCHNVLRPPEGIVCKEATFECRLKWVDCHNVLRPQKVLCVRGNF